MSSQEKNPFNLLTESEAAEALRIPVASLRYYALKVGALRHVRMGRVMLFRKEDLESFIRRRVYGV